MKPSGINKNSECRDIYSEVASRVQISFVIVSVWLSIII